MTFEEGTSAAWLHDLLKPHVSCVVVCDPRKNALLKDGSKSDRMDARKLAELLRGNQLHPVYHGEHGLRTKCCSPVASLLHRGVFPPMTNWCGSYNPSTLCSAPLRSMYR